MADNFCTQCGSRLDGAARFCDNCGSPVGKPIENGQSMVGDANLFQRLGLKLSMPGTARRPAEPPELLGVPSWILNAALSYSMMNAALDSNLLLVEDQDKRKRVIPLRFIENLQGLKVLCSVSVHYLWNDTDPSVREVYRIRLAEEIRQAFLETEKHMRLDVLVYPNLKPRDYHELDKKLRQKWVTVVNRTDDHQERVLIKTVAPLTAPCSTMKERLREHEDWIKRCLKASLEEEEDSSAQEKLKKKHKEFIEDLRTVMKEIPDDGFVDHICCLAYLTVEGQFQSTVLSDDEPDETPAFQAFKSNSRLVAAGGSAQERMLASIDIRRCSAEAPAIGNIKRWQARSRPPDGRTQVGARDSEPRSAKPVITVESFAPAIREVKAPSPSAPRAATEGDQPAGAAVGNKIAGIRFRETWEPNERAFSLQVPEGWKISGGVFNVNPQQVNGPANTILPKCDFTVRSDDRGTVMIRWAPSWNYADLTYAATGAGLFRPGQWYRGMPVRLMVSPRQFLYEMLIADRPQASGLRIVAEDPMDEVTAEFEREAMQVNIGLQQQGFAPLRFYSLSIVVEYREGSERYLESAMTTIADSRSSALMWTNERTVTLRAPAAEFESWMPVLAKIHDSVVANQEWLKAVERARGVRNALALQQQQAEIKRNAEMAASRRAVNAALQQEHEKYWATPTEDRGSGGGEEGGGQRGGGEEGGGQRGSGEDEEGG
jgi:hypothetical protein